jgi:hypothetical protein
MKKGWCTLLLLLVAVLAGCGERPDNQAAQGTQPSGETQQADPGTPQTSQETEQQAITSLVENFGKKLKMGSLLAPEQDVRNNLQTHYADFVSSSLLEKWQNDPQQAPGRLVSSPWPDRIDVLSIENMSEDRYRVKGEIIEVTSAGGGKAGGTGAGEAGGMEAGEGADAEAKEEADADTGETADAEEEAAVVIAAKRAITLEVGKFGDRWLIDAVELGAYVDDPANSGDATPNTGDGQPHTGNDQNSTGNGNTDDKAGSTDTADGPAETVVYENDEYGFRFTLPADWKGHTIVQDTWEGLSLEESSEGEVTESGPIVSIRHPKWTAEQPRQDIPIMVFTLDQWDALEQGKFHIGAAPVGPRELGRNSRYLFALPARYNYAFPTGHEEVEDILNGNPLEAVEVKA